MASRWKEHQSLLKGVSRSFYLSVKWLPWEMREPIALGYLLARLSDTIADDCEVASSVRRETLLQLKAQIEGPTGSWVPVAYSQHARERELINRTTEIFGWLSEMPSSDRCAIQRVARIITDGQLWDLERFHIDPSPEPVSEAELLDYTYLVAGCVGEFWTEVAFQKFGESFAASSDHNRLMEAGRSLGQGLQLVNIIRDLHEDLPAERCYLPEFAESPDKAFTQWLNRCQTFLEEGYLYIDKVRHRRIRFATALPLILARSTALELEKAGVDRVSSEKVKVERTTVWCSMLKALRS